VVPYHL
jgi:hypothetical protein